MNNNLGIASFNPMDEINNIDNRSQGNDGFAPPTGMSFGGDSTPPSAPDNMQFNSGPNLVSFVNN